MVGPISIDWKNILIDFIEGESVALLIERGLFCQIGALSIPQTQEKPKKEKKLNWKRFFYQRTSSSEKITEEHLKMIWWYVVWRRESLLVIRQVIEDFDLTHSIIVGNRLSNKGKNTPFLAIAQITLSIQYFQSCSVFSVVSVFFSGSVNFLVKSKK